MISLLLPTRKRLHSLQRFIDSAFATAAEPAELEIVIRVDDDDDTYDTMETDPSRVLWLRGPRGEGNLSEYWNECWRASHGDILGHMGDDIVFRTAGWDYRVRTAFDEFPDKLLFVHGDDAGNPNGLTFGTHGFVHRRWTDTVGHFVPPYFSSDWNDTWLNDVANALDRRRYIPIVTEHMHWVHGKGPLDEVHQQRLARGARDNVEDLYRSLAPERDQDIQKLREVISRES